MKDKIRFTKTTKIFIAIISFLIGSLFFIQQFCGNQIPIWPLFIFLTGLFLLYPFIEDRKQHNTIIPSIILILTGLFLFINTTTNWKFVGQIWPVLIFIISISFYIYYVAEKNKNLLTAANLLILIFFILIFIVNTTKRFWPIIFFIISGYFVLDYFNFWEKIKSKKKE